MRLDDELKNGLAEYIQSAIEDERNGRKRSAATMYFKAIAIACDYVIYSKLKKVPDNHAERFRILEAHFPALYSALSRTFPIYQQTYRADISAEQLEVIKDGLEKVKKLAGL